MYIQFDKHVQNTLKFIKVTLVTYACGYDKLCDAQLGILSKVFPCLVFTVPKTARKMVFPIQLLKLLTRRQSDVCVRISQNKCFLERAAL